MADNVFTLEILTPYGQYYLGEVEFLEVHSEDYNLGILPKHAPLISTLTISKMVMKVNGESRIFAIGGGVITVEKEKTTLILNSIESQDEIDLERAKLAKERAEKRLESASTNNAVDVNRAKLALLRAINRINIGSKD